MKSDASSFEARRRHRLSIVVFSFVSLPIHVTLVLHELLVGLGFLCSFAVASCWKCCRCCHFILWLLLSPSTSLSAALAPDLFHKTSTSPIWYPQISDLQLLRRVLSSSSSTTMNFLPSGKIHTNRFCCACGSGMNPLGSLFVRSMRLCASVYHYRTIPVRFLPFDDPQTKPCSLQIPFEAAYTDDCSPFLSFLDHNDQWFGFGSVKSPELHHGNAGVGSLCLESTLVLSEVGVKPISLSVGVKVKSSVMIVFFMVKTRSFTLVLARMLECFRCSVHKGQTLQAMKYLFVDSKVNSLLQCSAPFSNLRLLELDTNCPFKPSFKDEFNQISSRQGRERSFSTSSFSQERMFPPISLCVRGSSSSHSASVSFVATLFTAETLALRNAITSACQCGINALLICSDFWILNRVKSRGRNLEIALLNDILSNLSKFVSLSLICFVLDFPKMSAHQYVDVASNLVLV